MDCNSSSHKKQALLLCLPLEMHTEIMKYLNYWSIISVRLTCKWLYAVTRERQIWKLMVQELRWDPGILDVDVSSFDQQALEEWVARRQRVKDFWLNPFPKTSFPNFRGPRGRVTWLPGDRLCLIAEATEGGKIWLVDFATAAPEIQRFCGHDVKDHQGQRYSPAILAYCSIAAHEQPTFLIAVAYVSKRIGYDVCMRIYFYTLKVPSTLPRLPLIAEPRYDITCSPHGRCHEIILHERYMIRVMILRETTRIIVHPRLDEEYSSKWATAQITRLIYSVYLLPEDRLLVFNLHSFYIYELSELLRLPLTCETMQDPPSITLVPHAFTYEPAATPHTPMPLVSTSIPHIGLTHTCIVALFPDGLRGYEIPHRDPTKPLSVFPLFQFPTTSNLRWIGVGVSRAIICYQDGTLVTASYVWGADIDTHISVRSVPCEVLKDDEKDEWFVQGRFVEDAGRLVLMKWDGWGDATYRALDFSSKFLSSESLCS